MSTLYSEPLSSNFFLDGVAAAVAVIVVVVVVVVVKKACEKKTFSFQRQHLYLKAYASMRSHLHFKESWNWRFWALVDFSSG